MGDRTIRVRGKYLPAEAIARFKNRFDRLVAEDSSSEITFLFTGDCYGGNAEAVVAFIEHIIASGVPVCTRNRGFIHSAATLLFLVGTKRCGTKRSKINLHPLTINAEEIRIGFVDEDISFFKNKILNLYVKVLPFIDDRTRLTTDEIRGLFNARGEYLYFDWDKAKKFKLITEPLRKSPQKKVGV